ncbi:hypothetical protein G6O69_35185 [Pseudenhygromyxa sp. WMMC2535]|uniref:hypothetical protein n=1 Tax=Pseudenhygromyxa sp. WMMC2535 TaxID=2712867 RepID=UPI00155728F9|nr:hypothetical protein [Pseudenhygromyxa sp. WMMC2535]NVB43121.1 hypothetical protein [Pseudenhygromyxa sp. WMMC2535]
MRDQLMREIFELRRSDLGSLADATQLHTRYPGLARQLDGIDTLAKSHRSPGGRAIREWNPIAQRPYLAFFMPAPYREPPEAGDEIRYDHWPAICQDFAELGHELLHILAWEPFFVGETNPLTWADDAFISYMHLSEAACFFHSDVLYRDLTLGILGDERLRHRSVGFSTLCQSLEVLAAAGFEQPCEQLERTMDMFALERASLDWGADLPAFEAMRARIFRFVMLSQQVQARLLVHMRSSGIADEFYERFCRIDGLPRAHEAALAGPEEGSIRAYIHELLAALARGVGPEPGVRVRRSAQARAYYLWQLAHAAGRGLLADADGLEFEPGLFDPALAAYAETLVALAREGPDQATARLFAANELAQAVVDRLAARGAYVSQRQLMLADSDFERLGLPMIGVTGGQLGEAPSARHAWLMRCPIDWAGLMCSDGGLREALRVALDERCDDGHRHAALDEFARAPAVRSYWAVHASEFDFIRGRFREPCFELI